MTSANVVDGQFLHAGGRTPGTMPIPAGPAAKTGTGFAHRLRRMAQAEFLVIPTCNGFIHPERGENTYLGRADLSLPFSPFSGPGEVGQGASPDHLAALAAVRAYKPVVLPKLPPPTPPLAPRAQVTVAAHTHAMHCTEGGSVSFSRRLNC